MKKNYKIGFFVQLITASFCMTTVSVAQDRTSDIQRISNLLRNADNNGALALSNQVLTQSPHDCAVLALKGIALTSLGKTDVALNSYKDALSYCPKYLPALEGAAQIDYGRKDPGISLLLKRILEVDFNNVTAQAMLASILAGEGQCKQAFPHFEASRALFPSRPDLIQKYGSCLLESGNIASALGLFKEEESRRPSAAVQYDVAFLEWKSVDHETALHGLEPLISDNYERAYVLASHIEELDGNTARSVDLLRKAILLSPDHADNYIEFADLATRHNSFSVGVDMVNAGLRRMPDSAQLLVTRGVLEAQMGQNDAALADFRRGHTLDPTLSSATDAIGILWTQQHDQSRSLPFFQQEVKLHPNDAFLQFLLAEQLSQSSGNPQNLRSAIAAAARATHLEPDYVVAHNLLARLYLQSGSFRLATQQADVALSHDPTDQSALYQKIQALKHLGDSTGAIELSKKLETIHVETPAKGQLRDRYRLINETTPQ